MANAYIDLKNVDFYFEDGYSKPAVVGSTPGAIGDTTLSVVMTSAPVIVDAGVRLYITGHTGPYTVVSHTETTGSTTSVVITPALRATAATGAALIFGPHFLKITVGEGNLTYNEKVNREYKLDRGRIDQVRNGNQDPMDASMAFAWTYLSSSSADTVVHPQEFLKQIGPAAAYVTTGSDCEPFSINLVWINKNPTCGSEAFPWEKGVLGQFRYESLAFDAKAGTVSCTGKCNVLTATLTRLAKYTE